MSAQPVIVRQFGSERTHLMHPLGARSASVFGKDYTKPDDGPAICGAHLRDLVQMRPESKVRCVTCSRLAESEAAR